LEERSSYFAQFMDLSEVVGYNVKTSYITTDAHFIKFRTNFESFMNDTISYYDRLLDVRERADQVNNWSIFEESIKSYAIVINDIISVAITYAQVIKNDAAVKV
ncbi:unnamed protein product, partial [Owenia fusiformis]